jgi:uncharacterized protein YqeY
MSLQESIKRDLTVARLSKNKPVIPILSTLLGEAAMVGKTKRNNESTDEEVAAVVKKFISGIDETLQMHLFIDAESAMVKKLQFERDLIEKYLPTQLSQLELINAINDIIARLQISNISEVGKVMGELKKNFSGQYDGAAAIQLVKAGLK